MSPAPEKRSPKLLIWEELSNGEKLRSLCDAIDDLNNEMITLKARFDEFEKQANAWSNKAAEQMNNMARQITYNADVYNAWSKEVTEKINKIIFQLAARGIFVF
jgi:uncharacterized coiled-coil DUF342 family protein